MASCSAKVHVLFSDPLLRTGDVSVCDMSSSASGFAYVQLLPLAVERAGQIAARGSNLVTLSSPVFSPSSFPARVSQAVIAERCWRLRDRPESHRAQRGAGAFPLKDFKKTNTISVSSHVLIVGEPAGLGGGGAGDGSGATATPVGLARCSGDDWTGTADPRGSR